VRTHIAGEHSGLEGKMEYSLVLTFRKGKAVMAEYFWDHREALKAAPLPE
jgi:ketosteroid isomerase-like protein